MLFDLSKVLNSVKKHMHAKHCLKTMLNIIKSKQKVVLRIIFVTENYILLHSEIHEASLNPSSLRMKLRGSVV